MCHSLDSRVLLACSSTSAHGTGEASSLKKDLQKLAMLAVPYRIRIAYEALSWGRHINQLAQAAEVVQDADRANLGLAVDSFHVLANEGSVEGLDAVDPAKVFLVQLSDFLWHETRTPQDRIETARHYRVFPGEGVHSGQVATLVQRLDEMGYRGDYSFEVFNDDYRALPLSTVSARARRAAKWVTDHVSRRSLPLRNMRRTIR
jgi:sugar phosphate isomerase/epimerase